MQTRFKNLKDLQKNITIGQELYIENFLFPGTNRKTKVVRKQSYFFTIEGATDKISLDNPESWIINGATEMKHYRFIFLPDEEKVVIQSKSGHTIFILYFN